LEREKKGPINTELGIPIQQIPVVVVFYTGLVYKCSLPEQE